MNQTRSATSRVAIASAALCAGCSVNPVVQWRAVADPAPSIDAALADAQALRLQFEARAEQYLGRKLATNDMLFGLGVASFAAVASGAHKDVLAVTAGLGGSTYLSSTLGLQQSVLDAYQVGIGRVNCAATIGRSLRIDPDVVKAQASATATLRTDLPALAAAISRAEGLVLATAGLDTTYKTTANERIASARATLDNALAVSKDADALGERSASGASKLTGTLQAIHQAVNEMVSKGVPEPKAVLDALKSLAGTVDGFGKAVGASAAPAAAASAPGSGPSNQSDGGLGAVPPKSADQAVVSPASIDRIHSALVQMAQAQASVAVQADAVQERARRQASTVSNADFEKCVPDASRSGGFAVSDALLKFTANKDEDQSQTFTVSGGTTNYTARFASQPSFGITLVQPPAGGKVFDVKVPKSTKGPHTLTIVVEDSSPGPNQARVVVEVAPAAAPSTAPANEADGGRALGLPAALAAAQKSGASIAFGTSATKSRLSIKTWASDAVGTRVVMTCIPGAPPATISNLEARTRLLALLTDGFALAPAEADAARKTPARLALVAPGGCLK